jgi:hypothetical protein
MGRVIHFEIQADDVERAVAFYRDVFGWSISAWGGPIEYRLATTGAEGIPGIDGAIMPRMGPVPTGDEPALAAYVCTIGVDDLDAGIAEVLAHGGGILTEKSEIPGVGWFCYARDTEGNRFGMMQDTSGAA